MHALACSAALAGWLDRLTRLAEMNSVAETNIWRRFF
jgi:hypothetical protein